MTKYDIHTNFIDFDKMISDNKYLFDKLKDILDEKNIDFDSFYKSFKHFHPEIDLIVFDSKVVEEVQKQKPWINCTNCKASFAKLIYDQYDLLVNVDSDFYFFDR